MRNTALLKLFETRGMVTRVAAECNISTAAVAQWRRVPKKHLDTVSKISGFSVEQLMVVEAPGAQAQP